jgi:hypothetical protein
MLLPSASHFELPLFYYYYQYLPCVPPTVIDIQIIIMVVMD